jgi:NitT/TauT family transport system ATP-binding protein
MDIIEVEDVSYSFGELHIMEDISFSSQLNQFVSLIGPSGCGKSTLLRIMAGLIKPDSGRVFYRGKQVVEPIKEISFVFQDFGLLPWLTNIENVKVGLSAVNMSDEKKTAVAKKLLAQFKLDGFEDSYPNMLSGGMKQRIGVARAIASQPRVLLMDEPFSSVDELTAETLRSDIMHMLKSRNISVNTVVMVTHNVEEAVELSDKIVILSNKPSHVKEIKSIKWKYPRSKRDKGFMDLVDQVYEVLTR